MSPSAKLVRRGVELRLRGNDRRALTLFRRAYAVDGSAVALAQMGEAEHALGLFEEAHEHLRSALLLDHPWIERNRAPLERSLADTSRKMASAGSPVVVVTRAETPQADAVSEREWARLEQAEQAVAESVAVLAGVEGDISRLEATAHEQRGSRAVADARDSIAALEIVLGSCEKSIATLSVSLIAATSRDSKAE